MNELRLSISENLYELLEVDSAASTEEVRLAYERKLEEAHEESLAAYSLCPVEENEKRLLDLSMAFMKLADPEARQQYDLEILESIDPETNPVLQFSSPERVPQEKLTKTKGDHKVVYLRPQQKSGGFSTSSGEAFQTEARSSDHQDVLFKLKGQNVSASLEEITNQSAKMRQNAFQNLADKNELTLKKLKDFYQSMEAHEGVVRFSGAVLHQIRELKGISILELATVTCVRQIYLNAIEKENFEIFPSAVYLKGYLHCYIKALDLPLEEVSEHYMKIFEAWKKH